MTEPVRSDGHACTVGRAEWQDSGSLLFAAPPTELTHSEPVYFGDLEMTAVVSAIVGDDDSLLPYFYTLVDEDSIRLRHEVFGDLDDSRSLDQTIAEFSSGMEEVNSETAFADSVGDRVQQMRWHLHSCQIYLQTVERFQRGLRAAESRSRAMRSLVSYLDDYVASTGFRQLADDVASIASALSDVRYCALINSGRVTVSRYAGEPDYATETRRVLGRFIAAAVSGGEERPEPLRLRASPHVEAQILQAVAELFPDEFSRLGEFCDRTRAFVDQRLATAEHELRFYRAYRQFVVKLESQDLQFCCPTIVDSDAPTWAQESFDVALALDMQAHPDRSAVVCDSFRLEPPERILVVSGPNQGGKTTFARMIGQLHHLAAIGVRVPGRAAAISPPDAVYTHFAGSENAASHRGQLADELHRMKNILGQVTPLSVVIMNESFTSTSLADARRLGETVLRALTESRCRAVYVTFIDELSRLSDATVSMVGTVDPDVPDRRTYRMARRPADGRAYADAVARKYRLTYDAVMERLAR